MIVITAQEARKILGKDSENTTDDEIISVIETLDLTAKDALKLSKEDLLRKRDAKRMAELVYDIYQDNKKTVAES